MGVAALRPSNSPERRKMVELAEHILDSKTGHFDPAEFEDRYENAVVEMLKPAAKKGKAAGKVGRQAGKRKAG
jgi:non-homologous end joining protein Ku